MKKSAHKKTVTVKCVGGHTFAMDAADAKAKAKQQRCEIDELDLVCPSCVAKRRRKS